MLKKILKWIGIVLGVLVLLIGVLVFTVNAKKDKYDAIAIPYLHRVIPEIVAWDPDVARTYFAPEIIESSTPEQFDKLFNWLSKLGALQSLGDPQFQNVMAGATLREGSSTTVNYGIPAKFEHGDAQISITLLVTEQAFEIYRLSINSEALID